MKLIPVNVKRNKELIKEIFDIIGKEKAFISGGFARASCSERPDNLYSDVDIYSKTIPAYKHLLKKFKDNFKVRIDSEFSILFSNKWSLIKPIHTRFYGEPESVLNYFDFTVCQVAIIDPSNAVAGIKFRSHERKKKLVVANTQDQFALWTLYRTIKYCKYGYDLPIKQATKLFDTWHYRRMFPDVNKIMKQTPRVLDNNYKLYKAINQSLYDFYKEQTHDTMLKKLQNKKPKNSLIKIYPPRIFNSGFTHTNIRSWTPVIATS